MRKKFALLPMLSGLILSLGIASCSNKNESNLPDNPGPINPDKPVDPNPGTEPDKPVDPNPDVDPDKPVDPDINVPLKTVDEALDMLKSSPYKNNIKTQDYIGLNNLKNVGIDKERFTTEILDTIPENATVYIAEEHGINQESTSNTGSLSIFLKELKQVKGPKVVKFKKGIYKFSGYFDAVGVDDLYLVGEEGTEFLNYAWGTYFDCQACKNIHLINIAFDMKYSPTIAGYIKSSKTDELGGVVTLSIPDEFELNNPVYSQWADKTPSSYMECLYDEATGGYVPNRDGNLYYNSPTSRNRPGIRKVEYNDSAKELTISLNNNFAKFKTPKIGTKVSFAYTMYDYHGLHFVNCEDVHLENVKMYVSGGMGLRFESGKNVYVNRCHFGTRPGSERIMTSTADIFHTIALEGNLNITNTLFEGSHDDALNIKSFYTEVSNVSGASREISVRQTQNEVAINFEVGDKIEIYDKNNMRLVDTYTIKNIVKQGLNYKLKVDRRPKDIVNGYIVGNATRYTKMTLENCLIRNKRNRGILLQARDSKIINCTFQNVVMGAIQTLAVADKFAEALVPQNIEILNNKFLNNYEDISIFAYGKQGPNGSVPGTIKNIKIENNYHYNGKRFGVNLLGVGSAEVNNNLYEYSQKVLNDVVTLKASDSINIHNNMVITNNVNNINFIKDNGNVTNVIEKDNSKKEK